MKSVGIALTAAVSLLSSTWLWAADSQFDAASIKPGGVSARVPRSSGPVPVVTAPGRLTARNATLKELMEGAWGVEGYQVRGGPDWVPSARFDVEGKADRAVGRTGLLEMLQSLLTDRFKLAIHRETKELGVYALVVAKNGPKLRELTAGKALCWPECPDSPRQMGHMYQRNLPALAGFLSRLGADRPVVDRTGLRGDFALDLDVEKIMAAATLRHGPSMDSNIYEAFVSDIEDELGLSVVPAMGPVEFLVIDHVELPRDMTPAR